MRGRVAAATAAMAMLAGAGARGYSEPLHELLTRRAFASRGDWRGRPLSPPAEADLAALRALFWKAASEVPDPGLRAKFLARHPSAAAFDAWAFKELLLLNPAKQVHGFDALPGDRAMAQADLVAVASRWPDDDQRNRDRLLYDANRQPVKARDGSPMPYDPRVLWLGSVVGPSSQGHAHYGLLHAGYSDDPEVLKKDPRHFAVPPEIRAFGQDFVQLYAELALLAAGASLPSSDWLAASYGGAAFHHLEDVANQIHTVQVGVYDFFEAAFIQSKLRDVRTLGGLLGPRRSLEEIGLRLVSNHHLFSEDVFSKRVGEAAAGRDGPPRIRAALDGIAAGDPSFAAAVAGRSPYEVADALVEVSSHEGPEIYSLAWRVSARSLHQGDGHEYQSPPDDPDQWLAPQTAEREVALLRLYQLGGSGLPRAGAAVRAWQAWQDARRPQARAMRVELVQAILARVLPIHDEAARRRALYVPAGVARHSIAWGYPAAALLIVAALALLLRRAFRQRAPAATGNTGGPSESSLSK